MPKLPNPELCDGKKYTSGSGKIYTIREYQYSPVRPKPNNEETPDYNGDENPESENQETYRFFKITNSSKEKIGMITQFMPDNRIYSLIKRRENPKHMKPFDMIVKVSGTGHTNREYLYVPIPPAVIEWADIVVDDPIEITITRMDGRSVTDPSRHISQMGNQLIINLSRNRRLCRDLFNKDVALLTVAQYQEEVEGQQRPFGMFLHRGDVVKISVTPRPENHQFDFTMKTILSIDDENWVKYRFHPMDDVIINQKVNK